MLTSAWSLRGRKSFTATRWMPKRWRPMRKAFQRLRRNSEKSRAIRTPTSRRSSASCVRRNATRMSSIRRRWRRCAERPFRHRRRRQASLNRSSAGRTRMKSLPCADKRLQSWRRRKRDNAWRRFGKKSGEKLSNGWRWGAWLHSWQPLCWFMC